MSLKSFANGAAKSPYIQDMGFDPMTIMAIIQMIVQIFQSCKKPTPPPGPSGLPAKLVRREMERIRKGKNAGCPDRFRPAFAKNGCKNETEQDRAWCGLIGYAANVPDDKLEFME